MSRRSIRGGLLVLTPLAVEAWAMRRALPGVTVLKTGVGREKSIKALSRVDQVGAEFVVIAGFCGALDPSLDPGDVVVASGLRGPDGACLALEPDFIVSALRRSRIRSRSGLIISADRVVRGGEREELYRSGGTAVDMESAWLARAARSRPLAVVRLVVDTPGRELFNPVATMVGGVKGLRTLTRMGPVLRDWALHQQNLVGV